MRISLALQGGGSLGAFAWGVLDRLLEEGGLSFDTLSGSSAGAVNAAVLAGGLAQGGSVAARARLDSFWRKTSEAAGVPGLKQLLGWTTALLSPYRFNPLDFNPLRHLLEQTIDFADLRAKAPVRLLVGATQVVDGRLHLFREHELNVEMVLASACLPALAQAVEIGGQAYWDGGFSANPPLLPLIRASAVPDVLVVQILPTHAGGLPRSTGEIARRLSQMTFNASLLRDLDMLQTLRDVGDGDLPALFRKLDPSARLRLHHISAEDFVPDLATMSPVDLDWRSLTRLRDAGRLAAAQWLGGGARAPQPAATPAAPLRPPTGDGQSALT